MYKITRGIFIPQDTNKIYLKYTMKSWSCGQGERFPGDASSILDGYRPVFLFFDLRIIIAVRKNKTHVNKYVTDTNIVVHDTFHTVLNIEKHFYRLVKLIPFYNWQHILSEKNYFFYFPRNTFFDWLNTPIFSCVGVHLVMLENQYLDSQQIFSDKIA